MTDTSQQISSPRDFDTIVAEIESGLKRVDALSVDIAQTRAELNIEFAAADAALNDFLTEMEKPTPQE